MNRKTEQAELKDYVLPEARIMLKEGEALYSTECINTPDLAVKTVQKFMQYLDREYVVVINLDTALHPINFSIISIGGIGEAVVQIANVFKTAILANAASVILMHNHPSGNCSPSEEDVEVTKKAVEAGKLLDIPVSDHIVVGTGTANYFSFCEQYPQLFAGRK